MYLIIVNLSVSFENRTAGDGDCSIGIVFNERYSDFCSDSFSSDNRISFRAIVIVFRPFLLPDEFMGVVSAILCYVVPAKQSKDAAVHTRSILLCIAAHCAQIYCMELSCGVGFTSFWTHTGIHYVFSAEKGFVRVTTTKRVMTQEERFRERLQRRVDQENDE